MLSTQARKLLVCLSRTLFHLHSKTECICLQLGFELSCDPAKKNITKDHSYRAFLKQHHSRPQTEVMGMNGNCFFRIISKEILGTECHHSEIHQLICNFMESHPVTFSSWLYGNNNDYASRQSLD